MTKQYGAVGPGMTSKRAYRGGGARRRAEIAPMRPGSRLINRMAERNTGADQNTCFANQEMQNINGVEAGA